MGVNDWDGTRALALLRERMNRLFDERQARAALAVEAPFSPPADVYATDSAFVVTVELPGLGSDAFTVDIENGGLTVRGLRHFNGEGAEYHRLERNYGVFRCAIALPDDADVARRTQRLEAGVLTVEIPRNP